MDANDLVNLWGARARRSEAAHYQIAASYLRREHALSLTVVILSAATGSGIFATLSTTAPKPAKVFFGVIAVVAAVLAGINRSLRYGERAEENRQAGARWAPIVSSCEMLLAMLADTDPDGQVATDVNALERQMDDVAQHSPVIPQSFVKKNGIDAAYPWRPERTRRKSRVRRDS